MTDAKAIRARMRESLDNVKASAEHAESEVEAAHAQMKADLEAKKAETDATVAEWKAKREASKLEKRAEDDEDRAIESLYDARVAVDKAIAAVVDAAITRVDADEASRDMARKDAPKS